MRAATAWAVAHVRRRWVGLVALGIVAGLCGAATLTAIAGARRTATTYDRHVDATRAAHVQVTAGFRPELWTLDSGALDPILEAKGVDVSTTAVPLLVRPVGTDFHIWFDRWVYGAADDRFGTEVNRFRIVEGRAFDHRRADEAVITPGYAELVDVGVGDTIRFESWTSATRDAAGRVGTPPPDGPTFEVTVVGIAREFQPLLAAEEPATVFLTEALTRARAGEVALGPLVGLVRLDDPKASSDFAARTAAAVEQLGPSAKIAQPTARTAGVAGAVDAQSLALVVFALVASAAMGVVLFAGLARQLSFVSAEQRALRVIGMTRAQRVGAVTLIAAPTALVAAAVSAVVAAPASALLPIGTPGRVEPHPGVRIDLVVLASGAAAIVVAVAVLSALVGRAVTSQDIRRVPATRPTTGSRVARLVGASPAMAIGVHMALDARSATRRLPARSTIVGCVVGVTGTVAALAFATSLQHLTSTPRLYGWAADAVVGVGSDPGSWERMARRLQADPDIDELATFITAYVTVDGQSVNALVVDPVRGDAVNVIVSGRAPHARDEAVIGEAAADRLGVGIGDTIAVALADETSRDYRVVGTATHLNTQVGYSDSIGLLGDSVEELAHTDSPWYGAAVTFGDGVDVDAAVRSFRDDGLIVIEPRLARSVGNLDEVGVFPYLLAALLGVLAAVSLLHALVITTRRRGHDLAVLKALGFTTRQLRTTVASHASTLAVIGVLIGLPLGLGVGRGAWAAVTDGLGVPTEHILPGSPIVWIVAVIAFANTLSLPISRGQARTRPGAELRAAHQE